MNSVIGRNRIDHSGQVRAERTGFAEPVVVKRNASWRWVGNRIENRGDFWWTDEYTPHAVVGACGPLLEDANGDGHSCTVIGDADGPQVR